MLQIKQALVFHNHITEITGEGVCNRFSYNLGGWAVNTSQMRDNCFLIQLHREQIQVDDTKPV